MVRPHLTALLAAGALFTACSSGPQTAATDPPVAPPSGSPSTTTVAAPSTITVSVATGEPGVRRPLSESYALINGRLIDGTGAPPQKDELVVVRAGRISAVGSADSIAIADDMEVIDLEGATLLPGFINAHVHGVWDEDLLREFAGGGVTSVCDLQFAKSDMTLNEIFALRDALAVPGVARLAAAGRFINVPGGYPMKFFGGDIMAVTTPAEARQAVNDLADAGANLIKTAFESGRLFLQDDWPLLSQNVAAAIVEAGHERDLPVVAHVTHSTGVTPALAAGVDGITHMIAGELSDELIAQIREADVFVIPTIELYSTFADPSSMSVITENLSRLYSAGVTIVLGTDFDGIPGQENVFEIGMPSLEIGFMSGAGMTPQDIVTAATRNAAVACNLIDETGTLEVGKSADILIVAGDPLTDLAALDEPLLVLVAGVPVSP